MQRVRRYERAIKRRIPGLARPERTPETATPFTPADIAAAMVSLGVEPGDEIMVHSGLRSLGKLNGSLGDLLDAIDGVVGPTGTVMYPTFPFPATMNEYVRKNETYSARDTASVMGALTEAARRRPDARRSLHPTHPVAGWGPNAAAYLDGHAACPTPFHDGSPFEMLSRRGGKIVLLGVGLNSTTFFHVVEDKMGADFPICPYLPEPAIMRCRREDGSEVDVSVRTHNPVISNIRDCELVRPSFVRNGVIKSVPFGGSEVAVIDARAMLRTLEMEARTNRFTIYGKVWG